MSTQSFCARLLWGPRAESPDQLAARLIRAIEGIRPIDPLFSQWFTITSGDVFHPLSGSNLAKKIALRVHKSYDGVPEPREGYMFTVYNFGEPKWTPRSFSITIRAGSDMNWGSNTANFVTSDECDPDPGLVNFALFKGALLILAEAFEASVGDVSSSELAELYRKDPEAPRLGAEWMTYLGPRFARFANPPPSAIVDYQPNGGLLMAATDQVFSVDDPEHMAVARDIQGGCAAFNALKRPYPGLEWPEA